MIFRTKTLQDFAARNLAERARGCVANVPADVLARTAAFLLLKDSRSSFEIEGEHPPQDRIQRWGRAIGEAGRRPIDLDELLRLQRIVIGDNRYVHLACARKAVLSANTIARPACRCRTISAPGMKICRL